jgi:hypothetical protein
MPYQKRMLNSFVTLSIILMLAASCVSEQNLKPRFFYALGQNSQLFINGITKKTGQLRSMGYVLVPGVGAVALAMDPAQAFLYVANSASNDVAGSPSIPGTDNPYPSARTCPPVAPPAPSPSIPPAGSSMFPTRLPPMSGPKP